MQTTRYHAPLIIGIVVVVLAVILWPKHGFGPTTPSVPADPLENFHWVNATTTAPWGKRDAHSTVVFKNQMYVIGGLDGDAAINNQGTIEYWNAPHKSDIWRTADGANWELVTDSAPWKNRRSVATVVFQDKLWLMGGWDQYDWKYDNRIWFTEDGTHWTLATSTSPRWGGREGHTLNVFGGKMWLMGGVNFTDRTTFNDVWYSDDGFTWHLATSSAPWSPRYDHAVSTFTSPAGNELYLSGGVHINSHDTEAQVWVSKDGINWEKRTPEWPSRHGHIMLSYKDALWIIGGWHSDNEVSENDTGIADTWYTRDGVHWTETGEYGPWFGREDHMGEVFLDQMWFMGGMDRTIHWNSDVWHSSLNAVPATTTKQ